MLLPSLRPERASPNGIGESRRRSGFPRSRVASLPVVDSTPIRGPTTPPYIDPREKYRLRKISEKKNLDPPRETEEVSDTSHARLRFGQRRDGVRPAGSESTIRSEIDPIDSRRTQTGVGENGQLRSQLRITEGSAGRGNNKCYKLEMSHVLEVDRLLFIDVPDGGDASLDELAKPHQSPGPVAEGGAKRARISPLEQQRQTCTINIKKSKSQVLF